MDIVRIIFPSLALVLGVVTSVYFVILWHRHRGTRHARALLFWAIGLFLMFWFQVPAILTGFGRVITVTDFNLFFTLTFPFTFVALIMVYVGMLQISESSTTKKKKVLFSVWFAAAIIFFAYNFILHKGIVETYAFPIVGNLAFYIPIRVVIIVVAVKLLFRPEIRTTAGILGVAGIAGEAVVGLARNFFIIVNVVEYPPQFWYTVISGSRFFFVTQTASVILLVVGFFFLHRAYHRLRYDSNRQT